MFLFGVKIPPPAEKSRSAGADEGMIELYLLKTFITLVYTLSTDNSFRLSFKYDKTSSFIELVSRPRLLELSRVVSSSLRSKYSSPDKKLPLSAS